jgi:probable F420-dependent oxidoreductase
MDLYIALPNSGGEFSFETMVEIGLAAEELGLAGVMPLDHLLIGPDLVDRGYGVVAEPLIVLAYLAARTSRMRLGTSIVVVPMRNPFVVAKQAATLDLVSGGRFILGVGAGYNQVEFRNVGAEFRTRGARLDEAIRLFRHLFSGASGPFEGRFYGFEEGIFGPLPPQRERLPILIGGNSDAALRRAARAGDIWQSTALGPDHFHERAAYLRGELAKTGREVSIGARTALQGDASQQLEQLRAWREAGAQHLLLSFGANPARFLERLRTFAAEVAPAAVG